MAASASTPLSFTQQLQRQGKFNSRNNPFLQNSVMMINSRSSASGNAATRQSAGGGGGGRGGGGVVASHNKSSGMLLRRHAQTVNESLESHHHHHHFGVATNEADLHHDMDCMSPLYATPPHSPSSELSSPGQLPLFLNNPEELGSAGGGVGAGATGGAAGFNASGGGGSGGTPLANGGVVTTGKQSSSTPPADNHFARDTHMRIILGNLKENQTTNASSGYKFS